MKTKSLFVCIFLLSVLFACKNLKNSPEVKHLDSLKNVLSSVNNKLAEVDSQKVSLILTDYQNNITQVKMYFNDKKENGVWECITQYGIINDPLYDFMKNRGVFISEIQKSAKQLENLRSDFINKVISKEKFDVYFQQESDFIDKLGNKVEISVNQAKNEINRFDTLNPRVLKIIEKLKDDKLNSTKNK